nr:hypothetical protein [Tanacetum cinerariifolium]
MGIDCIFIGYAEHSKAYRFYVIEPNDSIFINSIIESRDAIFDENRFSSIPRPKDIMPNVQESQMDDILMMYQMRFLSLKKKEAINDEISSIMENNTWVLSDLPPGCKPLGFRQKKRINYFDAHAPVACITTIRLLLALETIYNLVIHQMDVKTAFLNGDLLEEVYMKQPELLVMPGNEHKVFNERYERSRRYSGLKIKRENKRIVIIQSHYIEKILKKFNHEDCSRVSTPMDPVEKLKLNTGKPMDQLEYSRAIGYLMYNITSTKPDIAYAYSDASWINHVEDSSSMSGWVFMLGGGAISWASKKKTCITGSTMESKIVALAAAGKDAEWLRNLIHDIPI